MQRQGNCASALAGEEHRDLRRHEHPDRRASRLRTGSSVSTAVSNCRHAELFSSLRGRASGWGTIASASPARREVAQGSHDHHADTGRFCSIRIVVSGALAQSWNRVLGLPGCRYSTATKHFHPFTKHQAFIVNSPTCDGSAVLRPRPNTSAASRGFGRGRGGLGCGGNPQRRSGCTSPPPPSWRSLRRTGCWGWCGWRLAGCLCRG